MEAIEELLQLSDSMRQGQAVLADEDVDETSSSSSRRASTFLNVVALGNVVSQPMPYWIRFIGNSISLIGLILCFQWAGRSLNLGFVSGILIDACYLMRLFSEYSVCLCRKLWSKASLAPKQRDSNIKSII